MKSVGSRAMMPIHWHPSPRELRRWSILMLFGSAVGGCVLFFLLGQPVSARVLWAFGFLSFAVGLTKTKAALPCYLLWMGLVWIISTALGTLAMAIVFFGVVTPIGLVARLSGRDRLQLRHPASSTATLWQDCPSRRTDRYDRPF